MTKSRLLVTIGVSVALLLVAIGVGVYTVVRSSVLAGRPTATASSASLLEDAAWLRPALETKAGASWLESARKLTISSGSAELITQQEGIARRYTVSPNGSVLRRGGAYLVAAEPFDLQALDLGLVPRLVAEARERSGSAITRLVVGRDEQGLLLWRAIPQGEAMDVYFTADGEVVPDPDDP